MTDPHLQREWDRMDAGYKQVASQQKSDRTSIDVPPQECKSWIDVFDDAGIKVVVDENHAGPPLIANFGDLTKRKRVYVSGAMSGLPGHNFPAFNEAADRLRQEGYEVVNPADKGIVDGWDWSDYLRYDIKQICDCDAVYMLKGWPSSRGARLELKVAKGLGLEVLYE